MGIHDGHRERAKERFLAHGLNNFDDHTALELLLYFAIPRRDVNELAHSLIDSFGNLSGIFDASYEELLKVPGVGKTGATLLKLVPAICRRYMISLSGYADMLTSTALAGAYLVPRFMAERDEVVLLVCLDAKRKVLNCREIARGSVNSAEISIRKIAEIALAHNSTSVILAHNHTSGIAVPSAEDERTTRKIKASLELVGVTLADHIVVANDDYVSMADSGILS